MKAATFLGGAGIEEFVAVAGLPGGGIAAFGNAWGPELPPAGVAPRVLGRGSWLRVNEFVNGQPTDWQGRPGKLDLNYPNRAGFITFFTPDATEIERLVAFDWNVASITAAAAAPDGGLVISGRSQRAFRKLAEGADVSNVLGPPPGAPRAKWGPLAYQDVEIAGDGYVARLSPDGSRLEWAWVFEGHRDSAEKLWIMRDGSVAFELKGLRRISSDGREQGELHLDGGPDGRTRVLAISPLDGTIVRGGDANSNTGREFWRKPLLLGHAPGGKWIWQVYDWAPELVGHDDFRLVADSDVRMAEYAPDGTLCVHGRSEGGNTVFGRSPVDLDRPVPAGGLGASAPGELTGSFCHFMRMDLGRRYEVLRYARLAACRPSAAVGLGRAGPVKIERLCPLADGSLAFAGSSAAYLAQTPDPWFACAELAREYEAKGLTSPGSGPFVAVLDGEFSSLSFCRAVPNSTVEGIAEVRGGIAVVCRTEGPLEDGQVMPSVRALQPAYGGGRYDGHLILLEKP